MDKEKLSVPAAIVVAGLIIAAAVFASGYGKDASTTPKGIGAQLGLNEKKLQACIAANTYQAKIQKDTESGDRAMSVIPDTERGTPYNVILDTKTNVSIPLAGAYPYDSFKQIIDQELAGTAKTQNVNIDPIVAGDHYFGNKDAEVVIVEYGDLECPYCAALHPTIEKLITDYGGKVAWVYRDFPLSIHANAQIKAEAAECASAQGGDTVFFKYIDAVYANIREQEQPTFDPTTL